MAKCEGFVLGKQALPKTIVLTDLPAKKKIEVLKQIQEQELVIGVKFVDKGWQTMKLGEVAYDRLMRKHYMRPSGWEGMYKTPVEEIAEIRILGKESKASLKSQLALAPIELKEEMKLSTVPAKIFRLIKKHRGTIISALDFVKNLEHHAGEVLLGIDSLAYERFARIGEIYHFSASYDHYGISTDVGDHTAAFMDAVTYNARRIVFLIPRSFFEYQTPHSREGSNITRAEFEWLVSNPGKMSMVTFVLGANNLIFENGDALATDSALRKAFRNPEKYLLKSD